jgi:cytochrome c553
MSYGLVVRICVGAGALTLAAWTGEPWRANLAIGSEICGLTDEPPPAWLYPINPARETEQASDPNALRRVPESVQSYTNEQVDDLFIAPDWHPEDHAPAPTVVSRGRPPQTYACGYCHRITGSGAPENAHLAGLSVAYIRQQLMDFRSGSRRSSRQERIPQSYMTVVAQSLTDAEIDDAARYFAGQLAIVTAHVVESRVAPSVHIENWSLAPDRPLKRELLGRRLLELPDDLEDFKSRDTRAKFTIYVPVGSVARGRSLANGGGRTGCTSCHGQRLQGEGMAPPLTAQSPSYLLRQLVDFSRGTRHAPQAEAMVAVARSLSIDDMIAVVAYAASLAPLASTPEDGK